MPRTIRLPYQGIRASATVGWNRELGWSRSTSSTYEQTTEQTFSYPVSPRSFVQIVQVETKLVVVDAHGGIAGQLPAKSATVKILEFRA